MRGAESVESGSHVCPRVVAAGRRSVELLGKEGVDAGRHCVAPSQRTTTQGYIRMPVRTLEVWFDFASTYSYIAIDRLVHGGSFVGLSVAWRPFLLGPVFQQLGWNDSPFNLQKAKGAYMWRDLERECARFGIPFRRPSQFPRNGLLAARTTLAGGSAAWVEPFIAGAFRANFAADRDIADPAVIAELLQVAGCTDATQVLATANSPGVKLRLREQTSEAVAHGIFGAPTLRVATEFFWGSDRLEQAIALARAGG